MVKNLLMKHLDFPIIEIFGITHFWTNETSYALLHFDLAGKETAVFIEDRKMSKQKKTVEKRKYYFDVIDFSLSDDPDSKELNELDKLLRSVKNPKNKRKASELNNLMLGALANAGYEKSIGRYFRKYWNSNQED